MESESWRKISEAYIEQIDSEKYCVLHDVTIHTEYGDTTQIDHIVIAETGVFVIETKNYEGWICGNEKSARWTQSILERNLLFKIHFDKIINI